MKKRSLKILVLTAMAGTVMQFGGCINFDRVLGSFVDHMVFEFVEPFVGDLTGAVTGLVE